MFRGNLCFVDSRARYNSINIRTKLTKSNFKECSCLQTCNFMQVVTTKHVGSYICMKERRMPVAVTLRELVTPLSDPLFLQYRRPSEPLSSIGKFQSKLCRLEFTLLRPLASFENRNLITTAITQSSWLPFSHINSFILSTYTLSTCILNTKAYCFTGTI